MLQHGCAICPRSTTWTNSRIHILIESRLPETEPIREKQTNGFEPLRLPLFRDRFIASTVSNLGTWMQDTAGTWLMTVLTSSPLLIALMQTAAALPVLALGLLAGATADIFDRRRLLIFWQVWMLTAVAILSVLTLCGVISPWWLLSLTFLLNIGAAMNNPAWQAIVPELVPHEQMVDAVTLNSVSNNLARATGPALGGLMVAAFAEAHKGAGAVFVLNALSFLGVIWVLWQWKRTPLFRSTLPAERMMGSMRSGLRYLRYSPPLQAAMVRVFVFTFCVSAAWALLAVVARQDLKQGAMGYGILNGSMGAGALIGGGILPRLRKRVNADTILLVSTCTFIVTLAVMAFVRRPSVLILFLVMGGFAWTSTMSTINASVQLSVPAWVQARALGVYQMTFMGGMALGSVLWGFIAEHSSTRISLSCAGAGLALTIPLALRFHIMRGKLPDLSPYQVDRPAPQTKHVPEMEEGPVRISVEYSVPPENQTAFIHAVHKLRDVRMRDGAIRWAIYQDVSDPALFNETFLMESWLEYLRQRERLTAADRKIQECVWSFLPAGTTPKISHMVYAKETMQG